MSLMRSLRFLSLPNAELVDHRVVLEPVDKVVEVAVADAQLTQPLQVFEGLSVDFLGHFHPCYSPSASSASQS